MGPVQKVVGNTVATECSRAVALVLPSGSSEPVLPLGPSPVSVHQASSGKS